MSLSVVILAAGKGKRMRSTSPKILHKLGGLSLLERVIQTAKKLDDSNIFVIYGFGGDKVLKELKHLEVQWVEQKEFLGTGHAVLQALPQIPEQDQVLVLVGDSPLVTKTTLQKLLDKTASGGVGLVTTEIEDPTGFGRILHDQTGKVLGIIEHKEASPEQRKIKEINSGIITAPAKLLKKWLPQLKNHNSQEEYYLTDIIALAVSEGKQVHSVMAKSSDEVLGINDRVQLAKLECCYQEQKAQELMLGGVTIMDPRQISIRGDVDISQDVTIDRNVIMEGRVKIGKNSYIGANCILKDVEIGEDVHIEPYSFIDGAVIDAQATIGPFARIRPGTHIKKGGKIGNFVEVKKTLIGENSKANHLAYLGDAIIGKNVNIGAGTITCNYDGVNKHQTNIADNVFIGSDTQLVAPVSVGEGATIGAGSTITQDVPANQLTISRVKQTSISGWKRPKKKDR